MRPQKRNFYIEVLVFSFLFFSAYNVFAQRKIKSSTVMEVLTKNTNLYSIDIEGKTIAYLEEDEKGFTDKKIIVKKNDALIKEFFKENARIFDIKISHDEKCLSFGFKNKNEPAKIEIINLDNNEHLIIDNGIGCSDLDFSFNNKEFLYVERPLVGKNRKSDIFISDFEGNKKLIIKDGFFPKWSHDGKKIAFSRVEKDATNNWVTFIWIYNINENNEHKIQNSKSMADGTMNWSPNNDKIANNINEKIGIIDIVTEELKIISKDNNFELHDPSWAPNGNKITFIATEYSNESIKDSDIYICNTDGTNLFNLTKTPDIKESMCSWITNINCLIVTNDGKTKNISKIEIEN